MLFGTTAAPPWAASCNNSVISKALGPTTHEDDGGGDRQLPLSPATNQALPTTIKSEPDWQQQRALCACQVVSPLSRVLGGSKAEDNTWLMMRTMMISTTHPEPRLRNNIIACRNPQLYRKPRQAMCVCVKWIKLHTFDYWPWLP